MKRSLPMVLATALLLSACASQPGTNNGSATSASAPSSFAETPTESLLFLIVDLEDDGSHVVQIQGMTDASTMSGAVTAHNLTFDNEPVVAYVFPSEQATDAAVQALRTGTSAARLSPSARVFRHDQTMVVYQGTNQTTFAALSQILDETVLGDEQELQGAAASR